MGQGDQVCGHQAGLIATFATTVQEKERYTKSGEENDMTLPRRRFLKLAAGAAALPVLPRPAIAQAYPTKPMTMIAPYAAGGPTDTIARIMAERMRQTLGQLVVVENITGAAGTIGVGRAARAAPDGYTISIGHWGTHVVNGAIYDLKYHVYDDF